MGNLNSCPCEVQNMKNEIKMLRIKNKLLKQQILETDNLRENNDRFIYKQNNSQNFALRNILNLIDNGTNLPKMIKGRKITHTNNTNKNLDLYVTIGGLDPQPIKKIATLEKNGGEHVFDILDYDKDKAIGYNASYNFNVLIEGSKIPTHNAGPTLAEFGTNQIWAKSTPELRDTFDISCVPVGIGNLLCDDKQTCRNKAINLSKKAGYTQQQAYNYNVGCKITPPKETAIPEGNLKTVSITDSKAPYLSQAITYPLDTALPKQQTGSAKGSYKVSWIEPVVSLGNYE